MSLLLASKRIAGGRGLARALVRRAPALPLDWDARQKSRFDAVDSSGRQVGVVLPRGTVLRGGDVLVVEDGTLLAVEASAQPLLVVTARASSSDPALDLLRAAYHLGNRHVPLEVRTDRLVLEHDHVLAELLARMGLEVAGVRDAFEPEAGAYERPPRPSQRRAAHGHAHDDRSEGDLGSSHGHGHGRGPAHAHAHAHAHEHEHEHADAHAHAHDPGQVHAHDRESALDDIDAHPRDGDDADERSSTARVRDAVRRREP